MAPLITLYILAACVAVAAGLFIVMIVLGAVRPPRLPDVPLAPEPPLQRVIRALTPPPIAVATAAPTPPAIARVVVAAPVVPQPPIAPRSPVVPQPPIVPQSPVVPQPSVAPRSPAPAPRTVVAAAQPAPPRAIKPSITLPAHLDAPRRFIPLGPAPADGAPRPAVYPIKRTRLWPRMVLGLFVTTIAATGVVIAFPHLLDPLCDDYAWFGEDAAVIVRDHAREARASIVGWLDQL